MKIVFYTLVASFCFIFFLNCRSLGAPVSGEHSIEEIQIPAFVCSIWTCSSDKFDRNCKIESKREYAGNTLDLTKSYFEGDEAKLSGSVYLNIEGLGSNSTTCKVKVVKSLKRDGATYFTFTLSVMENGNGEEFGVSMNVDKPELYNSPHVIKKRFSGKYGTFTVLQF